MKDHDTLQRYQWSIQRIAWIGFAAVRSRTSRIVLAEAAFCRTNGPVGGETREVPVILRWNAAETITINFNPSEEARTVVVDHEFYETFSLETIDPRPMATVVMNGRTGYEFPADANAKLAVVLRLQTQRPWLRKFSIGIGSEVVDQSVFIFP
ncbi:hypothetical protein B5K06_30570 [Rhizobium grahamii]|uniref:Uncharacterized protein n=2 Tax=Rhizobium grahamii TaxID=1120045 RepID=A0A370KGV9_9HYPH|nr:hypothetical protein B5K06_30570 [Rhizobium grahamii]